MQPPSRSSMWRLGFPTKKNFNDNALYCGGMQVQWQRNGGKCGICGDPYHMPYPRDNEANGKYGQGIITREYASGQVIEAVVDVTTNHRGYFEFKICPNNNIKREASQQCLDNYPLKLAYGEGTKYYVGGKGNGEIKVKLQLPKGLTCAQCVFQWTYVAGNNWGRCPDGSSKLGCGPQETFRGCADIAIGGNNNIYPYTPNLNDIGNTFSPYATYYKSIKPKYFKDTSFSRYPKYALEASRQDQRNKTSFITKNKRNKVKSLSHAASWMKLHLDDKRTEAPKSTNDTSYRSLLEHVPGYILQDSPSSSMLDNPSSLILSNPSSLIMDNPTVSSDSTYFTEIPDVETSRKESQLKKMLQQREKEIKLLRFYLQNPKSSSSRKVTRGFSLGGRTYKDFWYL
ncbi:chitin-binding type-4 domain-containing protein [Trichonephila clavata]|uniref:Chitin-binding type-4 domain-containing protein n=1 Tax=Trichonephila clavata TaxID=2740835 RepID=A0A8X6EY79_TRICU|nr:chitin-binding type-4 domain-containing protein [Trichonephila clavata]